MGRKKSGKFAAGKFKETTQRIREYLDEIDDSGMTDQAVTWAYEAALMKIAVAFESLMLECLIVALNNDSEPFSKATSIAFPRHMTEKVCEYLVTGGKFFDFKGRDGLLGDIGRFVGGKNAGHYLYEAIKKPRYHHPLTLLIALRNYAAHESPQSKETMKRAIVGFRLGTTKKLTDQQMKAANAPLAAGAWLKTQSRFVYLLDELDALADEIHQGAPY
ncbi:hypothetical protein ACFQ7F_45625 [Streptomyces sp. NPDC056486]|uniref:hypothetical protein n=1 Tax=Streptomyces sp. NPDC056486 TaxID=3345835 RepID=UPI0036A380EC